MINTDHRLIENFKKYFSVEFAKTIEQKKEVYKIRYHVYCYEFGYEPIDKYPNEEEKDEYDDYSYHCLIKHIPTGIPAGCTRLVPTTDRQGNEVLLPLEKHCPESLDNELLNSLNLNRKTMCEISRLAVDSAFRKRPGEKSTRFGDSKEFNFSTHESRTFPMIAIAAFLAGVVLTDLTKRNDGLAMMEPFLPRLLKRSGIVFHKVGIDVNYRGIRAPYISNTLTVLKEMDPDLKELYIWIYNQIVKDFYQEKNNSEKFVCNP